MSSRYVVGLDLGQSRDFTALAVIERVPRSMRLRYAERIALGTPYPEVVERVRRVTRRHSELAVDATGVGAPVVDMLRGARLGARLWPIRITSGRKAGVSGDYWRVPKRSLIAGLRNLLARGELHISARIPEAAALAKEMGQMRVRLTRSGSRQYGSWGAGQHDDLVMAVAMACWVAGREG